MARFEINVSGIEEIARSDGARRANDVSAQALEVQIAQHHPRGRGNVVRSLGRQSELDSQGWVVHVGYLRSKHRSASFGHLVEFGSLNNPPYSPIRTGVQTSGLRWDPT